MVLEAKVERSLPLGRRECGRALGALVVLLHGTKSTREDFAHLEERNAHLETEVERLRGELEKKRRRTI